MSIYSAILVATLWSISIVVHTGDQEMSLKLSMFVLILFYVQYLYRNVKETCIMIIE